MRRQVEKIFKKLIGVADFSAKKQIELLEDCWKVVQEVDERAGHVTDLIQGKMQAMVNAA